MLKILKYITNSSKNLFFIFMRKEKINHKNHLWVNLIMRIEYIFKKNWKLKMQSKIINFYTPLIMFTLNKKIQRVYLFNKLNKFLLKI